MRYEKLILPKDGSKISINSNQEIVIPDNPIIPFIVGDGIGRDITPVMTKVVNASVNKAYGNSREIKWLEIYAGEKANKIYGIDTGLPEETLAAILDCKVAIKGPLSTPVGKGIRSINVALRQKLDLYTCMRPVSYFSGLPSPLKEPHNVDMTIFRENSEDIYAGIEWKADSSQAKHLIEYIKTNMGVNSIRFEENCGIGIKPISEKGSKRLIRKAFQYAIEHNLPSVTLVHKGNIMKYTEGAFKDWGYQLAEQEFGASLYSNDGEWRVFNNPNNNKKIIVKDVIADAFLQQVLLRPKDYSVIATTNLNGDYISDLVAACIGGIGISPGANIGNNIVLFEPTHGSVPKYAGLDKVNPCAMILSAEMMLKYMGWNEAAELIINNLRQNIIDGNVTYDLHRLVDGANLISCSEFGELIIDNM